MATIVEEIQHIIKRNLEQAPDRGGDLLAAVIPVWENRPKYALDAEGRLIGLNLAGIGLTDGQWEKIRKLEGVEEHLRALNLCQNKLTKIHFSSGWRALQGISLCENKELTSVELPDAMPDLVYLDLSECALTAVNIPDGFRKRLKGPKLAVVQSLYLQQNKLEKISFIGHCPGLELLDISSNNLEACRFAKGFDSLRYLYLQDNKLKKLDFASPLRRLDTLHLRNNALSELPNYLLSFTALQTLYLHGNQFQGSFASNIPAGERDNAYKTVTDYLSALGKGNIPNERVKIIIVGNGRVGKTSIFKMLKTGKYDPDEPFTHGVKLGELDKSNLTDAIKTEYLQANVWDFGGQEIFYATHQFFLTDDALYVLAWTAEKNVLEYRKREHDQLSGKEKWRPESYWLDNIRHHSKSSPLIMVQTHADRTENKLVFKSEFAQEPYFAEPLDFSADNGEGLISLKNRITFLLNTKIPHLGEDFPQSWDRVIGELEKIKDRNKITHEDYLRICREATVEKDSEISILKFLHVTGIIIWFEHVKGLRETIFINPDWLTEQVYRLINPYLEDKKGRFGEEWISTALPYPAFSQEERDQLIQLLLNFQLIFEVRDEPGVYIAPQHLPEDLEHDAKVLFDRF